MESKIEFISLINGEQFKVYEMLHQTEEYYRIMGEFGEAIQINTNAVAWVQYVKKYEYNDNFDMAEERELNKEKK